MAHLLIVDDEQSICWGLARLGKEMGHSVSSAASAEEALALAARQPPDAIVLDVRLPGMDGLAAMERLHADIGPVPVILITAHGELETAVEAVRRGAFDYLVKPFDLAVAERAIRRALEPPRLPAEATSLPVADVEQEIVGISAAMQEVFKQVALAAHCDACIHIRGESGAGKELIARAIHRYSRRAGGPFVPVHAASLSPSLAESELFGHVRGAFTGADQAHKGLLERAHGGTIFLDEVADIPVSIQVKLLRVLEYGEVLPVGADRPVSTDFRIISATHQNLYDRVAEGTFRHDLYFRLATFKIEIPPLRARREDIRPLVDRFLDLLAAKNGSPRPSISDGALAELESRPWHGNVRELRNAVEHAMILARSGSIAAEHLPAATPQTLRPAASREKIAAWIEQWVESQVAQSPEASDLYDRFLQMIEPPLLRAVLQESRGQCATAARRLGLHRTTLRKRLDELRIETDR
jgi:two-component system nitrogen regulation response regulator GlnG